MLIGDGYTTTPHHRQNRRRERPGSRTRRTITRKSAMQTELSEGLLDAFDIDVQLPSERYNSKPSPLRRQNFELSWQRWKAREAEEKALAEVEKLRLRLELEEEQLRLFGGEVDDDELVRLGILYDGGDNNNGTSNSKSTSSSVSWALPATTEHSTRPTFTLRQAKPSRRSRRRSQWQSIPLFLSLSNLRDDDDIARLLAPATTRATFQHPLITISIPPSSPSPEIISADEPSSPLSLPTTSLPASSLSLSSSPIATSVNGFGSGSSNYAASSSAFPSNSSIPPHSLDMGDWTFITSSSSASSAMAEQGYPSNNDLYSPSSEPETWILLGDDL